MNFVKSYNIILLVFLSVNYNIIKSGNLVLVYNGIVIWIEVSLKLRNL